MQNKRFSITVKYNNINVNFVTNNQQEINEIKDCFSPYWTVEEKDSEISWTIYSLEISSIRDITSNREWNWSIGLFKNAPIRKNKEGFYYEKLQGVECLTFFNLEDRVTYFYHVGTTKGFSYIRNLVREPIAANYKKEKYIAMHASACDLNGKGIMMIGSKGAGKSTLLTHLLSKGANYLGNDAVYCKKEQDSIKLVAYPQSVRMSEESIYNNKEMYNYFKLSDKYEVVRNKVEFLPKLFNSIFEHHEIIKQSNLDLIIVPNINVNRNDYIIKEVTLDVEEKNYKNISWLQQSLFHNCHRYIWSPQYENLNNPLIDLTNLYEIFSDNTKICYIEYGVLGDNEKDELFRDIKKILIK